VELFVLDIDDTVVIPFVITMPWVPALFVKLLPASKLVPLPFWPPEIELLPRDDWFCRVLYDDPWYEICID